MAKQLMICRDLQFLCLLMPHGSRVAIEAIYRTSIGTPLLLLLLLLFDEYTAIGIVVK